LSIKEAREARVEDYLTASFKTALKAANRDKTTRTEKHVQDKLLHRDINKLVKEEAKTNSKVDISIGLESFSLSVSDEPNC
jgi:hypothetical protein